MKKSILATEEDCRRKLMFALRHKAFGMEELLLAGLRGDIHYVIATPGDLIAAAHLELLGGTILVLCDCGDLARGPSGWIQAKALLSWSQATLIQCTRGFRRDYDWITGQAKSGKKTLLIETGLKHLDSWDSLAAAYRPKGSWICQALPSDRLAARPSEEWFGPVGKWMP